MDYYDFIFSVLIQMLFDIKYNTDKTTGSKPNGRLRPPRGSMEYI